MTGDAVLYDVRLRVVQEYENVALSGRHIMRLAPLSLPDEQDVIVSSLTITPAPSDRQDFRDFFGNTAVVTAFTAPHDQIEFDVTARVRRRTAPQRTACSSPLSALPMELDSIHSLDPASPHHFLARSPKVPVLRELAEYARQFADPDKTVQDIAEELGLALHRDMKFDAKATDVDTPIAEAFEKRHGVCQDFTHIMIGCLRSLGISAGYVSGFLRTIPPEGKPRLEGADAMHAWVRIWCGASAGWAEYDPTNAIFANADHIVIARGRDYFDVAPVKGILRTAGAQKSEHFVDMVQVEAGA